MTLYRQVDGRGTPWSGRNDPLLVCIYGMLRCLLSVSLLADEKLTGPLESDKRLQLSSEL